MGRRKKGLGQVGGSGIALVGLVVPISLYPTPSAAPGEGLDVQGIHTGNPHYSGSVRCTGSSGDTAQPGLSTTSHIGENTLRCCTSHQHPQHLSLPGRAVQAAFPAP